MDLPSWLSFTAQDNKELLIAAIGSFAGAVGGAWGAQRIAERKERRERLRKAMAQTNLAIGHVYVVFEKFANVKDQYLKEMGRLFENTRKKVIVAEAARRAKGEKQAKLTEGIPSEVTCEIVWTHVDVSRLEKLVLDDLNLLGRPASALAALIQDIETFEILMRDRASYIRDLKASRTGGLDWPQLLWMFGVAGDHGADSTFRSNVAGLIEKCDECIYFCKVLYEDLHEYGTRTRFRYRRQFKGPTGSMTTLDFSVAGTKGLLPDPAPFKDWESCFINLLPETEGRQLGKWLYAWRRVWRWYLVKPWWRNAKRARYLTSPQQ